jgi:hypothetical protein
MLLPYEQRAQVDNAVLGLTLAPSAGIPDHIGDTSTLMVSDNLHLVYRVVDEPVRQVVVVAVGAPRRRALGPRFMKSVAMR